MLDQGVRKEYVFQLAVLGGYASLIYPQLWRSGDNSCTEAAIVARLGKGQTFLTGTLGCDWQFCLIYASAPPDGVHRCMTA